MTDLRTAAQQALEAWDQPHGINYVDFRPYMEALRAALAEPAQEPVGYFSVNDYGRWEENENEYGTPFYAAPPQRKPLTEEEIKACEKQAIVSGALPFEQRVFFARAIEKAHGIGVE